jgi:hypothetical protein
MADLIHTPALKTKRGEMRALRELDARTKSRILPLVDFLAVPDGTDPSGVQEHIRKSGNHLIGAWPKSQPMYVDLFDIAPTIRGPRSVHPVTMVFEALMGGGFEAIPVIGLDRDSAYLRAIREMLPDGVGKICVRLLDEDFLRPEESVAELQTLLRTLDALGLERHAVLDFRAIENKPAEAIQTQALNVYSKLSAAGYARIVFLASSMPPSLATIRAGTISHIERREFAIWRQLRLLHRSSRLCRSRPASCPTVSEDSLCIRKRVADRQRRAMGSRHHTASKPCSVDNG